MSSPSIATAPLDASSKESIPAASRTIDIDQLLQPIQSDREARRAFDKMLQAGKGSGNPMVTAAIRMFLDHALYQPENPDNYGEVVTGLRDQQGKKVPTTNAWLATMLDTSERTIERLMLKLKADKRLSITRGGGPGNNHIIHVTELLNMLALDYSGTANGGGTKNAGTANGGGTHIEESLRDSDHEAERGGEDRPRRILLKVMDEWWSDFPGEALKHEYLTSALEESGVSPSHLAEILDDLSPEAIAQIKAAKTPAKYFCGVLKDILAGKFKVRAQKKSASPASTLTLQDVRGNPRLLIDHVAHGGAWRYNGQGYDTCIVTSWNGGKTAGNDDTWGVELPDGHYSTWLWNNFHRAVMNGEISFDDIQVVRYQEGSDR